MTAQALAGTSAGSASNVGLLTRRITTGASKNLTAANLALAKPLHGASTSVTRGYPAPRTPSPGCGRRDRQPDAACGDRPAVAAPGDVATPCRKAARHAVPRETSSITS
jgi:hypothetical protein